MREDWLRVNDVKQWFYCPRVVFYQNVMAGVGVSTYKMGEGKKAQDWYEKLELRRALAKYGMEDVERVVGQYLESERLGLRGKVDLLLRGKTEAAVVDYKLTGREIMPNQKMQVVAYSLLAEDLFGLEVRRGFVYRISDGELFEFAIGREEKERVLEALETMRKMLREQELPEPTEVRARCEDCEYANFCGDVF